MVKPDAYTLSEVNIKTGMTLLGTWKTKQTSDIVSGWKLDHASAGVLAEIKKSQILTNYK